MSKNESLEDLLKEFESIHPELNTPSEPPALNINKSTTPWTTAPNNPSESTLRRPIIEEIEEAPRHTLNQAPKGNKQRNKLNARNLRGWSRNQYRREYNSENIDPLQEVLMKTKLESEYILGRPQVQVLGGKDLNILSTKSPDIYSKLSHPHAPNIPSSRATIVPRRIEEIEVTEELLRNTCGDIDGTYQGESDIKEVRISSGINIPSTTKLLSMGGLGHLHNLQFVDLSHNMLRGIGHLESIGIITLILSHNQIKEIINISHLVNLQHLDLSYNLINGIPINISTENKMIKYINLGNNSIDNIEDVLYLKGLSNLTQFMLSGNKCSSLEHYQMFCLGALTTLSVLDGVKVTEGARQAAALRFANYENNRLQESIKLNKQALDLLKEKKTMESKMKQKEQVLYIYIIYIGLREISRTFVGTKQGFKSSTCGMQ